jgi:hypothetical protein
MIKTTLTLLICFSSIALQAQSINERIVDSAGNIIIVTNADTLNSYPEYCYTSGIIYNSDSINQYGMVFYFHAPQTFFLTAKDKIRIRYNDGQVNDEFVITDGEFIMEGDLVKIMFPITENALNKMLRNSVTSIILITEKFRHTINVDVAYNQTFKNLSDYMLNINVYDENGIKWSELTKMKFPEN